MQFGIVIFFLFSAYGISANYCTIYNDYDAVLLLSTEFYPCRKFTTPCLILACIAAFYLVLLTIFSLVFSDRRKQSKFYDKVDEREQNYFGRISESDRKRWIASEYYRRERYGI